MLGNIDCHEQVCHSYRTRNVTNVAKVEVGRVLYLKIEAEGDGEHDEQEVDGVHDVGAKKWR
jgi:phosphoribosylformylglycinamidine (FGAM) synthase PurS component